MERTTTTAARTSHVLSATNVIGARVRNSKNESLGKIEDIVLDTRHGRIAYAVLSFGGFMGLGSKLFPIPWQALAQASDGDEFILDVEKEALREAPGFEKEELPDFADQEWGGQVYGYYGYDPYW